MRADSSAGSRHSGGCSRSSCRPPGGAISLRTLADEQLRGVINDWQRALERYAHGLRSHDAAEVNRAFTLIRSAEGHQARARALLAELEQRHRDGTRQSAAH